MRRPILTRRVRIGLYSAVQCARQFCEVHCVRGDGRINIEEAARWLTEYETWRQQRKEKAHE